MSELETFLQKSSFVVWNSKRTSAKALVFDTPLKVLFQRSIIGEVNKLDDKISHILPSNQKGFKCNCCGIAFIDLVHQIEHFKSEVHVINLKRRMNGLPPLQAGNLSNSESNAGDNNQTDGAIEKDSDGSEDENESLDESDALVIEEKLEHAEEDSENQKFPQLFSDENGSVRKTFHHHTGPMLVCSINNHKPWEISIPLGLLNVKFSGREWTSGKEDIWNAIQISLNEMQKNSKWVILLMQSGRFTGVVFENRRMVVHKVLRRYTVRAKAGGGQSSHDNKSGKAKSAGAMLRRYGEQALNEDIKGLLHLWSSHIQSAQRICISAPKTMRSIFFDSNDGNQHSEGSSGLSKEDSRIFYIPFATSKPTLEAAQSVYSICTTLIFTMGSSEESETVQALITDQKNEDEVKDGVELIVKEKEAPMKMLDSEMLIDSPLSKLIIETCLSRSEKRVAEVLKLIKNTFPNSPPTDFSQNPIDDIEEDEPQVADVKEGLDVNEIGVSIPSDPWDLETIINLPDDMLELRTPLHIASSLGMQRSVIALLQLGANPLKQDIRSRVPYFVAKDKETRDAFRKYRGMVDESRWDWTAAGIPSALTPELEKEKKQKEKEKKKRLAQKKKEQKIKDEMMATALKQQHEEQRSTELQYQIDNAGNCANCQKRLYGIQALDIFERRCCSSSCILQLRRTLAAEAALKRLGAR